VALQYDPIEEVLLGVLEEFVQQGEDFGF